MSRRRAQNSASVPPGRPFARGHDARRNAGGRPREEREVVEALRLRGLELADRLIELGLAGNVKAIAEAFNRAYGKARQVVELTGNAGGPVRLNLEGLSREDLNSLEEILARGSTTVAR